MFLFIYILIGIFLGPSFINASAPESLFSVGAFGFLFIAGLELNLEKLSQGFRSSFRIAAGSFLVPFVAGLWLAVTVLQKQDFRGATVVALALAISALPVVIQILKDLRLYETQQGHQIVAAATLCDILAWVLFTLIIPAETRNDWILSHLPVFFFFLGLGVSRFVEQGQLLLKTVTWSSRLFFGPIFFIGVGMKIHWQESFDWQQCLLIFAVASLSKMAGVYFTSRSSLMALVLNARGAMEILFCTVALKLGLIDATLFTSLTVMAVLSSVLASPLVKLFVRK